MNNKYFLYILLLSTCFLIPSLFAVPVGMIPDMDIPYDGFGNHTHFSPLILTENTYPQIDNLIPIVSGSVNISQNLILNHGEIKNIVNDSTADQRIYPKDLIYRGAFRVPMPDGEEYGWAYGGGGLSYYPKGDTDGPNDGYLGSLFGMGHDQRNYVTEITIPKPKISSLKRVSDLNTARTLQSFKDLNAGTFTDSILWGLRHRRRAARASIFNIVAYSHRPTEVTGEDGHSWEPFRLESYSRDWPWAGRDGRVRSRRRSWSAAVAGCCGARQ